ncbi:hypothetical protein ACRALDRAFT_1064287 [Sodiomyces alcalophilus JCM 7366]|uniref:uncharacterized protein n=1 Tax=Sodiomyces alcalophilus JCM 7366 TaxID=591952 RepID=UPI0039B408E0
MCTKSTLAAFKLRESLSHELARDKRCKATAAVQWVDSPVTATSCLVFEDAKGNGRVTMPGVLPVKQDR